MSDTEESLALRANKLVCLGQPAGVQKLLNAGADPDGRVKGMPHIMAAARQGERGAIIPSPRQDLIR